MSINEDKFEEIFAQGIRTDFELDIEQKIVNRLQGEQSPVIVNHKRFAFVFLFLACCLCPFSLSIFEGLGSYSIEWIMPILMGGGLLIVFDSITGSTKMNSG